MYSSTVKVVVGFPPREVGSNVKEPSAVAMVKTAFLPLHQVGSKEVEKLQAPEISINVSRRDLALSLTASSLAAAAATLSIPKPVEARVVKPEIRRKIMEKLRMLREKAGLSKPETENAEKSENIAPSPPLPKEKELPLSPLPNLGKSLVEVEVTLP